MPKLSPIQLAILTAAAKRENRSLIPVPAELKLSRQSFAAIAKRLIRRKLAASAPAAPGIPVWSERDGQPMMLVITEEALREIGATANDAASTTTMHTAPKRAGQKVARRKTARSKSSKGRHATRREPANRSAGIGRSTSKQTKVIDLLRRPHGATIKELMEVTSWQAHSVRGVISGALKKKLGLAISSAKEERGRIYKIVGASK